METQQIYGFHSCCGIKVLTAVKEPKIIEDAWSNRSFDFFKDREFRRSKLVPSLVDAAPVTEIADKYRGVNYWEYFQQSKAKFIVVTFIVAGDPIPGGFTVRATTDEGSLCTKVGS